MLPALTELEIGLVAWSLALAIFGVQGLLSVAIEGRELRPGRMGIDRLMPGLVLAELRQNRLQMADVSEACRTMVHDAWRRADPSDGSSRAGTVGAAGR